MSITKLEISDDIAKPTATDKSTDTDKPKATGRNKKFGWYWSPIYCAAWFLLFYVAVIPSYYSYPETLYMRDEQNHPDEFIGERAEIQLLGLSTIGVKLTGTVENEVLALNFLLHEIDKIKAAARNDLYDIEVDVQYSTGQFMLWGMATSYHNVPNIIVKIAPKGSQSQSYLLVNSHYDSEVSSPAAADAGVMIVIMLETLRVISISEKPLRNPIVFLLNGAEESNLLAAHGFITQHRWAPYCKALINLDSAGSGGREVLFQSGPNHPWLMKYYKEHIRYPYASTVAEELFQNNFIPSDTDFRIFRDYGNLPGLDMAHTLNGYIYHTKYDNFQNMERGTYQTTGDNVLAMTWALANAEELEDTEAYAEGHTVFYDVMGWFMIFYTESASILINLFNCGGALVTVIISVFLMTRLKGADPPKTILKRFSAIFLVQLIAEGASVAVTLLMAVIVDALGITQSWYSADWMIFGLYFCPTFFVLGIIPAIYIQMTKRKTNMQLDDTIICFMHAHCTILCLMCFLMAAFSIRSAFFPMVASIFYPIAITLHEIFTWFFKKDYFIVTHLICQVLPFWFYTYLTYAFMHVFIPMQGRDGPTSKPELLLAGFAVLVTIHFAGFILPVLYKFRKSKIFFSFFGIITIIFLIIAATPAGFPYKPDVAPQRFYVLHTNRIIHDENGFIAKNESGFYIQPVDTRPTTLDDTTLKYAEPESWINTECEEEMYCGLPLYNTRWMNWKNYARWIKAQPPNPIIPTELTLTVKEFQNETVVRYAFNLKSADRAIIYVEPMPNVMMLDWSFDRTPLKENYKAPYFMYHMYSMDNTPLEFWFEMKRLTNDFEGPMLRIGVTGHFLYHTHTYSEEFQDFLSTFPDWVYPINWVASYESWYY